MIITPAPSFSLSNGPTAQPSENIFESFIDNIVDMNNVVIETTNEDFVTDEIASVVENVIELPIEDEPMIDVNVVIEHCDDTSMNPANGENVLSYLSSPHVSPPPLPHMNPKSISSQPDQDEPLSKTPSPNHPSFH